MNYFRSLLALVLVSSIAGILAYTYGWKQEIEFVIVVPTYNNERYCLKNIQSVVDQSYPQWHMMIVNDCSTDRTGELIRTYIKKHQLENKITFIDNQERKGALRNLYEVIHQCPDKSVIITLDGDDCFATDYALERIAKEYADEKIWLTYGQYMTSPEHVPAICAPIPERIMKKRLFRSYHWVTSHPRTFYAWLFKKILREDLMHQGKFFPVTWDLALMFPLLEMASKGHIRFIPNILYIYNIDNPLNDYKVHFELQQWYVKFIREKKKYEAL